MITTVYKRNIVKVRQIWFSEDYISVSGGADINFYHGMQSVKENCVGVETKSVIVNLQKTEDELYRDVSKTSRNQINRCQKEKIVTEVFDSKTLSISDQLIEFFRQCYESMYASKGMVSHYNADLINAYIRSNAVQISSVRTNEEFQIFHFYLSDNYHTLLLYSCSDFRQHKEDRNFAARVNKYLHWQDYLYFKEHGIKEYNWGGIYSFDNPNGIDEFKLSLCNDDDTKVINYSVIEPCTLLGRVVIEYVKRKKNFFD